MSCCSHCESAEEIFGPVAAQRALKRYRKEGPSQTTKLILRGIRKTEISDAGLLDIGAGIGVLHHELLGKIVNRVTHVDASRAFIAIAQDVDEQRGQVESVKYLHGDAVDVAENLPNAEIVTLDKVICCYPDWENLVRASANKAEQLYAISIPRDRWIVKLVFWFDNLIRRIKGDAFRTFVHPRQQIDTVLKDMGFECSEESHTLSWQVAFYSKAS